MATNQSLIRLKRRLFRLPKAVRDAAMKQALLSAHDLAGEIAAKAPKDEGDLAASVRIEGNADGTRWYIKAGGKVTTKPVRKGQSATYDYALGQEFGREGMPAQPFFWPTYRRRKTRVKREIREAAVKAAKDSVNRG